MSKHLPVRIGFSLDNHLRYGDFGTSTDSKRTVVSVEGQRDVEQVDEGLTNSMSLQTSVMYSLRVFEDRNGNQWNADFGPYVNAGVNFTPSFGPYLAASPRVGVSRYENSGGGVAFAVGPLGSISNHRTDGGVVASAAVFAGGREWDIMKGVFNLQLGAELARYNNGEFEGSINIGVVLF